MNRKLFGRRINAARRDLGLTGEKLAEACNINVTYLRQIEAGTKLPSMPMFVTLCKELKVSPNYLLLDVVEYSDTQDMGVLFELLKKASPSQMRIVNAMVKAALDSITSGK